MDINILFLPKFWVDEKNSQATDAGPGTPEKPFKTIAHAFAVARRGRELIVAIPPRNYSTKYMKELPEGMTDQEYEKIISANPWEGGS